MDAAGAWLRKAARLGDTKAEKTRLDGPTDRDGGYAFTRGIDVDSLGHLGPWLSYQFLPRGRPPV